MRALRLLLLWALLAGTSAACNAENAFEPCMSTQGEIVGCVDE